MAYKASLAIFPIEGEALNAANFNDYLDQYDQEHLYFKPRFVAHPIGGYTRKTARQRCLTGEFTMLSARSTGSDHSAKALATNIGAKFFDPEGHVFDKQVALKSDLKTRFKKWAKTHLDGTRGGIAKPYTPSIDVNSPRSELNDQLLDQDEYASQDISSSSNNNPQQQCNSPKRSLSTEPISSSRPLKRTPSHLFKRVQKKPAMYFPNIGKGCKPGNVPVVLTDHGDEEKLRIAHMRPYEKPWLMSGDEIYFDKKKLLLEL
jgi:hypothetical protein